MTDCEELYMMECKHYAGGVCAKRSGWRGGFHFCEDCTGDCARMKRYRKIKAQENKSPEEKKRALLKELADLEE